MTAGCTTEVDGPGGRAGAPARQLARAATVAHVGPQLPALHRAVPGDPVRPRAVTAARRYPRRAVHARAISARDVLDLLDRLGCRRGALRRGLSLGGMVGMWLAAHAAGPGRPAGAAVHVRALGTPRSRGPSGRRRPRRTGTAAVAGRGRRPLVHSRLRGSASRTRAAAARAMIAATPAGRVRGRAATRSRRWTCAPTCPGIDRADAGLGGRRTTRAPARARRGHRGRRSPAPGSWCWPTPRTWPPLERPDAVDRACWTTSFLEGR